MKSRAALLQGGDSGPAIIPGKSAQSLLIKLVSGSDADRVMPPEGNRLTVQQIETLKRWIDAGADWPASEYELALKKVNLPPGNGHPIDRLIHVYTRQHELTLQPLISDERFARRVAFDLIGIPLTDKELSEFVGDTREDKREQLIERLLGRQEDFIAHWLTFWSDHLRIGSDVAAAIFDSDETKAPRQWLQSELEKNVSYDRFVSDLIAGDFCDHYGKSIAPPGEIASHVDLPEMQLSATISQVFLGIQLKCASCHDSFVDRWTMDDAWGFASAIGEGPLEMYRCDLPTDRIATPKFPLRSLGEIERGADKQRRREQIARLMTLPENGLFARTIVNRIWARLLGRGFVEPLDEMMEHEPWSADLLDWTATEFIREKYDLKKLLYLITTSQAYQRAVVIRHEPLEKKPYFFTGPEIRRLTAEEFADAIGELEITESTHVARHRAWEVQNNRLMTMLGRPSRDVVVTSRNNESTTLLQLELINGKLLEDAVSRAADAQLKAFGSSQDVENRIYRVLLGRNPNRREQLLTVNADNASVTRDAVSDLIWTIIMLPEFQLLQ